MKGTTTPAHQLLELDAVSVHFAGLQALSDVSFSAQRGEVLAIIGSNGAGKTTLFNAITGYVKLTGGSIRFNGHAVDGLKPHSIAQRGIRRTFQNGGLFPTLTVLENILAGLHTAIHSSIAGLILGGRSADRAERAATDRALELLDLFGIRHLAHRSVGELPGGEQRTVEIIRALATDPPLLLLDEPAVGLTPQARDHLLAIIRRLAERENIGVLLVEHAIDLVMSAADRIVVLNQGCKIADGPPEEIRRNEQVLEAYLGYA